MSKPVLICACPSTPEALSSGRMKKREIPQDLLMEASRRLSLMSLMACVLWIVANLAWHLTWPAFHPGDSIPGFRAPDTITVIAAVASLALWLYIRQSKREPKFFLNLGLAYLVLTCFAIALVMHWGLPEQEALGPTISWTGVVILMFAAVLPVAPRNILIAGLIGALMNPIAMGLVRVHGMGPLEGFRTGFLMHYTDVIIVGIAYVISRVVTRIGRQVTKAREMGAYEIGELIRRGGMGEIYRAKHRMLARPAAIKLIRAEMLGTEEGETADLAIKRFHREAEAAANLRSPHTVELFDFGVTDDNTLYFVMELLEGVDLETLVRESGALPARRVIHILRQACESLAEAHEQGLIHRDIKPANIHLGKAGIRHDFVKILDFGLVKSVHQETSNDSLATAVGRTPGTPAYMAPEMSLGESVDGRADIYALGCVGYFLLTGHLVFDATSPFQMVAKHLSNAPVPPSFRGKVEIPQQLETVILKCLAKKPDQRFASVIDLSNALAAVHVRPWTDEEALDTWKQRQPSVVAVPSPAASDRAVLLPI
jgi:eukaryotic-like serine/threonine-protein kinase